MTEIRIITTVTITNNTIRIIKIINWVFGFLYVQFLVSLGLSDVVLQLFRSAHVLDWISFFGHSVGE